jgi:hypothetical protein
VEISAKGLFEERLCHKFNFSAVFASPAPLRETVALKPYAIAAY